MTDTEGAALSTSEFWDERYSKSDGEHPTHEWFRSYAALEPFLSERLFKTHPPTAAPRLLHLGSGDSTVPADLSRQGYHNQLCVDFSPVVVKMMSEKTADVKGLQWQQADIRDMPQIADSSIDVAFDKGTLDAMIHGSPWDPPDTVKDNARRYLHEVSRILKPDGVFLYITFRQPHFIKPILNADSLWSLEMDVLGDPQGGFDYFGYVLRKAASSS